MNQLGNIQSILNFLNNQDLIAKYILVILLILFTLFSIILSRQIKVMDSIVNQVTFSPILETLATLLIVSSALLLLFTIFVV